MPDNCSLKRNICHWMTNI